jgi:hypothetical protein
MGDAVMVNAESGGVLFFFEENRGVYLSKHLVVSLSGALALLA